MDDVAVDEGAVVEESTTEENVITSEDFAELSKDVKALNDSFTTFTTLYTENNDARGLLDVDRDLAFDTYTVDLFSHFDKSDEAVTAGFSDMTVLLDKLVTNTQPSESVDTSELDSVSYYSDVAVIGLIMIVLPLYVVYRVLKSVFGFTRYMF